MPMISMLDSTKTYVEDLQATGLYGYDFSSVVETLLLRGIREAITMKLIQPRTFPDEPKEVHWGEDVGKEKLSE